ncbi:hypothetical protein Gotur_018209 [Gossypium turneri]
MRPMPMEFVTDPDDQGSAMEVDDVDTPEIFGEGVIASDNKLAYADFFNNFETESVESVESIPPQPPSSSQALVSATFSPSVLCLKSVRRSALFGVHSTTLQRSRCQLAPKFQSRDDSDKPISEINMKDLDSESLKPSWLERGEEIIPSNIERKGNSVDLPLSLRIIKRKLQWQEGFRDAGESTYCSMKKAFSKMVFIIRELHSYTLQMRELLFDEDLQGVLVRVQKEMHASFVWLFQQVFSHTPTFKVLN